MSNECSILILSISTGSCSTKALPSKDCFNNISSRTVVSIMSKGVFIVRTKSYRKSATTQPSALVIPGRAGTKTSGIPSSLAKADACNGPAPPNANKLKSRGSAPKDIDTMRIAPAIKVLAIRKTADAAVSASTPSGFPIFN